MVGSYFIRLRGLTDDKKDRLSKDINKSLTQQSELTTKLNKIEAELIVSL